MGGGEHGSEESACVRERGVRIGIGVKDANHKGSRVYKPYPPLTSRRRKKNHHPFTPSSHSSVLQGIKERRRKDPKLASKHTCSIPTSHQDVRV